jgi:2-dehydro-3-deoxyphosphooctonate aldolase (KDO 8-P synthase)
MKLILGPCVLDEDAVIIAAKVKIIVERHGISEWWFKASFDKANRTAGGSYRGPGVDLGLVVLRNIRDCYGVKVTTDVHEPWQVPVVAEVADLVQVPALLSRQTDLLTACGTFAPAVNIKKGQFMAPWDVVHAVDKVREAGCKDIYVTERGTSFGYNRLVVDMLSFPIMKKAGLRTIFDCTHSLQLPGAGCGCSAGSVEFALPLARAAVGAGAQGVFAEVHTDPSKAKCDGPNSIPLDRLDEFIEGILEVEHAVRERQEEGEGKEEG